MADWVSADAQRDIQIVPVRVFWGKAPEKEQSFLRIWLQISGILGGRLVTFNGHSAERPQHLCAFQQAVLAARSVRRESERRKTGPRKAARMLRVHNRQVTAFGAGPGFIPPPHAGASDPQ